MRKYTPLWETLKRDKVVSITANRLYHPRIIKAVGKEKWKDIGYKVSIEPHVALLSHTSKHAILTFKLELKVYTMTAKQLEL